ncbi:nuclear transport factor 2 family protein [Nonomuraea sp. SBT364]|uniref:nuclear transport factor 2 family protein n=1 Tax=Nonomuraea sp. SBT364 TaxID=1580530 RepID=UPI00066C6059|nr:nuclear transport factor 2 family protein [Nonomuraea sp. SBT364]
MKNIDELIARYIATWNETDPAARRAAIDELWSADGVYTDPMGVAAGTAAIDATIAAVQEQFPGFRFTLGGPVDAHHDIARFTWELAQDGAEALVVGFDVAVFTADGRIDRVHGFLDKVPTGA